MMTRISATMSDCGTRGTSTRKMPGYRKERKQTHFPYVHSSASPDACTGTFSRANTAAHHPHISSVGTPHLLQGERESSFSKCFTSIQVRDVFVECHSPPVPTCVVFALCSAFKTLSAHHTLGRSRHNSPSARARWSESGQMADSAQNTGHDLNFANLFSYVDPEHTPTIFPNSHHDYQSRRHSDSHLS